MSLSRLTVIIPTFYPGRIIEKCLASLPSVSEIIIIDNGEDLELEKIIRLQKHKIKHYKVGDIGLSKSFNIALAKSKNENILITQPDVYFEKNAILNLIKAQKKYNNAGIISPLSFVLLDASFKYTTPSALYSSIKVCKPEMPMPQIAIANGPLAFKVNFSLTLINCSKFFFM